MLGVDGGQSGTQTVLATTGGHILAAAVTGPMTHIETRGGFEQVAQALRQGYERVFAAAGQPIAPVGCVHVGLSGVNDPKLVRPIYQTKMLTSSGDAHIALVGAFPVDHVGIVVTAGTGSHAYGRRSDGQIVFAGGRGYYLGDEGGGTDIAQQAFRAAYQADDGRSEPTILSALIPEYFHCRDLQELMLNVYAGAYDRHQLAQASKLVGLAAGEGDEAAIRILAYAGHELGKAVAAVLTSLELTRVPFPIAPNGSVFKTGHFVTEPMMDRVRETNPCAYLTKARFPPPIGAVLLALQDLGITLSERIFSNIQSSIENIFQKG